MLVKQYDQIADEGIADAINSGEHLLYEVLVRRYNPYLYKIGRSYGFNHEDTEDLMQDSFISAYNHLKQFQNKASLKTWMCRIMLNKCYHKTQKLSYQKEISDEMGSDKQERAIFQNQRPMEKQLFNRELGKILELALQRIPESYRMVFTLRELNGLSTIETADTLSITQSNVKIRFSRAKKLLQKEVEKSYSSEDIFEFNLIFCDPMVERVMNEIK